MTANLLRKEVVAIGVAVALPLALGTTAVAVTSWPPSLQPTVAAALIAAVVGILTIAANSAFNAWQNREKIRADIDLSERRFAFDIEIASAKISLETRLYIDKKKADFAETALEDFYNARAKLREIRSPAAFASENEDRIGRENESEELRRARDQYYPCLRRIRLASEFFNAFYARRYRAIALFGGHAEQPYVGIWSALSTVQAYAASTMRHTPYMTQSVVDHLERAEQAIWAGSGAPDEVANEIDQAIALAEEVFRPVLIRSEAE